MENEAKIIIRIFRWYADGMGQGYIAAKLNRQGVPGPHGPWSRYTIHEMLGNEKYHGVHIWGKTKKYRDPETGRKVPRDTPESARRRVEVSDWRIVPEDLWKAVQERRKSAREAFHQLGGMTRTKRGRTYLFSGTLYCGKCGGSMVICAGEGKRGYVKYGCHAHKHNGMCDNSLMIRQDRLEQQLLSAIQQRVLNTATIEVVVTRCETELRRRLTEMQHQGSLVTVESLKRDLEDRKRRLGKLIEVLEIAEDLRSPIVRVRDLEGEIKRIEEAISNYRPVGIDVTVGEIRDYVAKSLLGLRESLSDSDEGDLARAKNAICKHIGKLVLIPMLRDGHPIYRVTGTVTVQDEKCRMQVVARDGIAQHYASLMIPFAGVCLDPALELR